MPNGVVSYFLDISSTDLVTGNPAQLRTNVTIASGDLQVTVPIEPYVQYIASLQAITGGGASDIIKANVTSDEAGRSCVMGYIFI